MTARPSVKREAPAPSRAPLPMRSRQWSCSELRAGNSAVKKVKTQPAMAHDSLARLEHEWEAHRGFSGLYTDISICVCMRIYTHTYIYMYIYIWAIF